MSVGGINLRRIREKCVPHLLGIERFIQIPSLVSSILTFHISKTSLQAHLLLLHPRIMAFSNTTDLAIAELVIYILLIPPTFWLLLKHGRRGLLAYVYFVAFEILRIVAAGILIADRNQPNPSTTGAIINSVGLSPLLLTYAGFLHELRSSYGTSNRPAWIAHLGEVVVHISAVSGIALAATGGAKLADRNATPSDINSAHTLQEVGAIILLLTWLALAFFCVLLLRKLGSDRVLGVLMLLAGAFIGARAIYTVVYAFDHSRSINVFTGTFVIKLVLVFLVQLLAVLTLLVVGFMTRHINVQLAAGTYPGGRRAGDVETRGDSVPLTLRSRK